MWVSGVWERQIQSVRNVLNSMLDMHKTRLDSTTLSIKNMFV